MRIGIDSRCLEEVYISGVGEYTLEVVQGLLKEDSKNEYIIFSNSYKKKGDHISHLEKFPNAKLKRFNYPNKLLNSFLWYFRWPKLDRLIGGANIFFAPNINFLAISTHCRLITTFHDLSFEYFPKFFTLKTRLWHFGFVSPRNISKKTKKIIAVSDSTKKDLEKIYKISAEKISTVYHGVSSDFQVFSRNDSKLIETQKKYKLPYKFIFYLGNIESRKNIKSIIEAHKKMVTVDPALQKYKLVLAGKINPLCRDIIEKEKENLVICGYIKREDRPLILNLASLFVYPSHFEGFGLPILESMACGTPVVTSNNSSLPEVSGNAAVMVSSDRPSELYEAMKSVLQDKNLYEVFFKRGLKQAKKFNWKKCAKETLKVFREVGDT